jgi:ankyrin repeat protein
MKTHQFNLATTVVWATVFATLFLLSSCDKERSADKTATAAVHPAVDIHTAVVTENTEALKQHIDAGSNLNERDPFGGSSPLISAAVFDKPEMAKTLIEAGADINFQNNDGSTALHTASYFCRPQIVKMLLDKGADKTIKNKYGLTAFEMVAGPFHEAKSGYDMIGKMLEPMGLKLDYTHLEKTRPEIAAMLK